MFEEILPAAAALLARGEAFALAVVVRREAPISGHTGDKALIRADGSIAGWIGGGCTQPLIIQEAQKAINDGKPRFVRVTPGAAHDPAEGIVQYNMTCHGGGTIDVYIEPVLPKTHLIIIGKSPVAQNLARLAHLLHYRISVYAAGADSAMFPDAETLEAVVDLTATPCGPNTFIVVSTQGEDDETALQAALNAGPGYLAFVASRKKAKAVFAFLRSKGVTAKQLRSISVPAGLDIKAHLPEEIAISILAEIIQKRNSAASPAPNAAPAKKAAAVDETIDPVCGMSVNPAAAKHTSQAGGRTYAFCCAGCKERFDKQPEVYIAKLEEAKTA